MKLFLRSALVVIITASCSWYEYSNHRQHQHPITMVQAFTTTRTTPTNNNKRLTAIAPLQVSRRDYLALASSSSLVLLTTGSVTMTTTTPAQAAGDIDYGSVQDLLKSKDQPGLSYEYSSRTGRPMYLTEPTEEFKQNEAKTADFKRDQLKRKQEFLAVLEKLQTDPNDEKLLASDLDTMTRLVRAEGGLPLGVTKEEIVKQVRRRKAKKFWSTNVEIA